MANQDVNLNRLAVFVALVDAGSFTAAAQRLDTTKSRVSQHLAALEKELGASLLVRSTRRMALTSAGAQFHADSVHILEQAHAAIARVGVQSAIPSGLLRITAAGDYGAAVVAPALTSFLRRYPQLKVDLVATDRVTDLIAEHFDLSIRVGWLRDSGLRAVRLTSFRQCLVASPAYLAEHGTPKRLDDLPRQRWIELSVLRSPLRWTFSAPDGKQRSVRVQSGVQANSALSVHAFVLAGAGMSVLPDYLVQGDVRAGRLVVLLPRHRLPDGGIFAVYPERQPSAKVRAFIEHMREFIAQAD
ncbi:LysR family transcriptional regulator [Pseudolysobacter antarcticus]|uniref:LysR family transcriptional regulator n=1 Tax=Pseudolysobacter antarcticus TaxID=2511995 RepID=A0A411HLX0_9GAMM|nr:LysR family transcriptional regulator [Pseudolysobacter antarcticus]QBB71404.1 LysR family transcriptional regulator [Pseudolysobacter antarcticus]